MTALIKQVKASHNDNEKFNETQEIKFNWNKYKLKIQKSENNKKIYKKNKIHYTFLKCCP